MSAKPFHRGHDGLIKIARDECHQVQVIVSLKDRENVSGEAMKAIWHEIILPRLDATVYFPPETPVRYVYKELGALNDGPQNVTNTQYAIYGDPSDLQANFPDKSLTKYLGNLYRKAQVRLRPVPRHDTMQISGTDMRRYLREGNRDAFRLGLPSWMDAEEVWERLSSK